MRQTAGMVRKLCKMRLTRLELALHRCLRSAERSAENLETLFHFSPGDQVLRRRKALGKLEAKAEGPFEVVRVGGQF